MSQEQVDGERRLQKPSLYHRQSSTLRYNTFPTAPPRQPPRRASNMKNSDGPESPHSRHSHSSSHSSNHHETPLPKRQLGILAVIALAEQTALNSISPYLPEMASSFPEVDPAEVGMYVGLIASAFALAQFATNFMWGWLSDKIGRKPIILLGTFLTAAGFVMFGFCRTLWQAILVQAFMGLVNGNQGVVSTCLGEITDRSNQSRAFKYLPVIYGIGGITGPIVGGLLVSRKSIFNPDKPNPYPYLLPNLFSAAVLMVDLVLTMIFLKESLECAQELPPLPKRVRSLFTWIWQFTSSHRPTYLRRGKKRQKANGYRPVPNGNISEDAENSDDEDVDERDEMGASLSSLLPGNPSEHLSKRDVFTRDTILLLVTFLIFQLANISYNSLYPIFAQASPPTGRSLNPEEIGISLAFAGVVTILFQIGIFGTLREKIGNKITYRAGLAGFVIAFILMPWVGYKDGSADGSHKPTTMGQVWLWIELGAVLIIKTIAAVGGLTSALLLITNSAPSHAVLGTLNGLAQTLSAAGRAVGPFISGSLFTAATRVKPKGEALAFGIFGGISFIGFLLSFGIRSSGLEAEGWDESENDRESGSDDDQEESPESSR
jgi:MFS family permease